MMGASLDVAKELEHRREPDLIFCSHQTHIAITFAKQFSGRRIIEARFPEPGGGSMWSAAG
jgi:hypothetical protein